MGHGHSDSYYCGIVMHRGYFNFPAGEHDIHDTITVMYHIHDILVRLIFKMVDYDGVYQPSTMKATASESVN